MKLPPYIRGLGDLFSTGKRVAITLGILGTIIIIISAASSTATHLNNPYYAGPIVTVNAAIYVGVIIIAFGILAFIGDIRYSAMRQRAEEVEGQQRLRSAEDRLAKSLEAAPVADKHREESTTPDRSAVDDALALSVLWELTEVPR